MSHICYRSALLDYRSTSSRQTCRNSAIFSFQRRSYVERRYSGADTYSLLQSTIKIYITKSLKSHINNIIIEFKKVKSYIFLRFCSQEFSETTSIALSVSLDTWLGRPPNSYVTLSKLWNLQLKLWTLIPKMKYTV